MQDTLRDLREYLKYRLKFCIEQNRKATFNSFEMFVFDDSIKRSAAGAAKLAEAGFIYIPALDWVKCFVCRKKLDSWEEGDNPWDQHETYCSFGKLRKPEKEFHLNDYINIRDAVIDRFCIAAVANEEFASIEIETIIDMCNSFK